MEKTIIQADTDKNRLYITLNGFFTNDELVTAADKIIEETNKLKPGFIVINDISNFKPASQSGMSEIKRAQMYVKEKGAQRIIRVIGEAALTSMQLSRTAKEIGYEADAVATVAEAEKLLGN